MGSHDIYFDVDDGFLGKRLPKLEWGIEEFANQAQATPQSFSKLHDR